MKTSFDCDIKAVVQTNCDKRSTNTINFYSKQGMAIFSEKVSVFMNPNLEQMLKVTLLIVKQNTTKMVGIVNVNLANDPIADAKIWKYSLDKCPIPDVKMQMSYEVKGKLNKPVVK
jgi:hypothetical protein